jgi:3-phenylpropionate/trans-cinnamate dioxygenase ferredoxin reductase subunit
MRTYRYLIVGGGMTADAACKGIRARDAEGSIGLVSYEGHPPYSRPPLTKGLWKGTDESTIWLGTEEAGVELQLTRRIASLDLAGRRAVDERGDAYTYELLLLATGGRPRRFPFDGDDVIYYRTVDDYSRLRGLAREGAHFVVVGSGFIGSEIAAALAMNGCHVTMVFPGPAICARLFPPELSAFVTGYYHEQGVEVLPGESVAGVERDGDALRVSLASGRVLGGHGVVAGLGIEPNDELAAAAGLKVDDGIAVDEYGRVIGADGVFAAGDVARFPVAALGGEARIEHEDHALTHGRSVGENMAGAEAPYEHLPFFYSDLFDLGYEAVGEIDSRHETVADWKEPHREGVVYYLDGEQRVRGVLLWNVWDKVDEARTLIRAGEPVDAASLKGRIG